MSNKTKRFILPEEEIPHYWYNIQADMVNKPMPPLNPATKQPLSRFCRRALPPRTQSDRCLD